jgi:hypothetical protein
MTGLIGALVALAVVLVLVLVLAVRPPARRAARALADLRADLAAQRARLQALRRARPAPAGPAGGGEPPVAGSLTRAPSAPSAAAVAPSLIGDRGRHRRLPDQP